MKIDACYILYKFDLYDDTKTYEDGTIVRVGNWVAMIVSGVPKVLAYTDELTSATRNINDDIDNIEDKISVIKDAIYDIEDDYFPKTNTSSQLYATDKSEAQRGTTLAAKGRELKNKINTANSVTKLENIK
jgi:uncharacterized protein YoxC